MDQDEEHRVKSRGRSHRKSGNKENRNEKTTPKGQPARVVLKSNNSSATKSTPRITLRNSKTTPKSSSTMRETPPSRKEASPGTRQTFSSLRTTPGSHTKDSSPTARSKVAIRKNAIPSFRDHKDGQPQQLSIRTPPSVKINQACSKKESFVADRKLSGYSEEGSDWTLTPIPQASIDEDGFTTLNGPDVSSGDELGTCARVGDSPFHADGELSGDDLESRMRSFLRKRERSRISRRSEIKSVKWDPAIVACGPLTPITNKSKPNEHHASRVLQERPPEGPTRDLESSLDNLNQIAADLKKADRRILQQLLEALKNVDSSDDTIIIRPKKARNTLGEQNMKDNHPKSTSTSPDRTCTSSNVKALNPEAPVYRNSAPVKARLHAQKENRENKENIPHGSKWPLNVQRKRPHSNEDGKDIRLSVHDPAKPNKYIPPALRTRKAPSPAEKENIEPIWIKTSPAYSILPSPEHNAQSAGFPNSAESLLDAPLDQMYGLQTPLLAQPSRVPLDNQSIFPPSWMTGFQNIYPQQLSQPLVPMGFYSPYGGLGLQPSLIPTPMLSPDWYPAPMVPVPTLPALHEQIPKPSDQPGKNFKNRTKRLPVNMIPTEAEPGRIAVTLEPAWATQVLEKFMAKYPKTGTKKPLPKPTKEKKVATKIQQRLEVLLLYQKEKKAMEEKFGHSAGLSLPRTVSCESSDVSTTDSLDVSVEMS